jgi:acylphosphatase
MKKQYTITLSGRVKELSFMRFTEDLLKRIFGRGIIYDVGYYETKILCEAEEDTVNEFCRLCKENNLVSETKVEEGIQLPRPGGFLVPI